MKKWNFKNWKVKLLAIHKSFTSWFNVAGIAYLQALANSPMLEEWLNANDLVWVLIIGNVTIRLFKTNKAIEDK